MSKQVVVLIHGGASSGRVYKDVTSILERGDFTCITPDLPGHGSLASQGQFTFESARKVIAQSIQQVASQSSSASQKIMLVGISLGGQAVLSFLQHDDEAIKLVSSAIVSGASIAPTDERADWELPHMPTDQEWLRLVMEDAKIAGWENMQQLKGLSLGFTFDVPESKQLPPVLAVTGEHDTAMSKRDLPELTEKLKKTNAKSESYIMQGAWHNHSIDVPEDFSKVIIDWAQKQTT